MVKSGVAVFFLLLGLALTQCMATDDAKSPSPPTPAHPGFSWWHPDPKLIKCMGDYRAAAGTCYREVCVSFWTQKVTIQEDCCKAIVQLDGDCSSAVFSRFNNPFFQLLLKEHCSNKGESSAPAPPKATPSPPKA
ncbi:hypothetical protein PRUPE_2G194700 [Prunus persica]|uniref:Prolamin-like domain-containing protein n=1 Tax=Prunus persica TaxID=3760 RepID=A0A251QI93_PRUPE|nr:hypothetical protein PRUPE_2G194700 [Prunus persica]